ncbi:hypothetical protein ANN_26306 [Periplaneta americana]|uniref:DUF4817 domain-containing protein n=1 Tax=Periplaneta americana TaxID=6978 RepID=A0ABQ8S600_PERAM|nr:hypothetical protein ANN_26306 [Periplaneta americana]
MVGLDNFKASIPFINHLKHEYGISSRHVTTFVTRKDIEDDNSIRQKAQQFVEEVNMFIREEGVEKGYDIDIPTSSFENVISVAFDIGLRECESDLECDNVAFVRSLPSKETLRGHSDSSIRGEGYIQCCVGVRLCDMYSNQELAEIHFMYGKADGNAVLARRLYQERYPQRQCPDRKTFVRLHYCLCEYGKFNSPGLGRGRPRSTTPEVQEEILEAVNMTPSISTQRVVLQVNVPHTTVWRLLKEYQLYPYHLQRVQALSPADYPARVRFCQWFLQQCGVNPNFPALVLFTDEA